MTYTCDYSPAGTDGIGRRVVTNPPGLAIMKYRRYSNVRFCYFGFYSYLCGNNRCRLCLPISILSWTSVSSISSAPRVPESSLSTSSTHCSRMTPVSNRSSASLTPTRRSRESVRRAVPLSTTYSAPPTPAASSSSRCSATARDSSSTEASTICPGRYATRPLKAGTGNQLILERGSRALDAGASGFLSLRRGEWRG